MRKYQSVPFRIKEHYNENDNNVSAGFHLYTEFQNINAKVVYVNERGILKSLVIKSMNVTGRELHHLNELRINEDLEQQFLPYQYYDNILDVPNSYKILSQQIYGVQFPEPAFIVDVVGVSHDFFLGASRVLSEFEQFYYKHMNDYSNIPHEYFRKQGSKLYLLRVSLIGKKRE